MFTDKALDFYQKFISPLLGNNCRYYPSCSEYARVQLLFSDNKFVGFINSCLRILRCNQLFAGGVEYPSIKMRIKKPTFGKKNIKYWLLPQGKKSRFLVIKNFSFKDSREKTLRDEPTN